jgi:hypothetical protein
MLTRRNFFKLGAAAVATMALDPEKLLWTPGEKTIFLPPAGGWATRYVGMDLGHGESHAAVVAFLKQNQEDYNRIVGASLESIEHGNYGGIIEPHPMMPHFGANGINPYPTTMRSNLRHRDEVLVIAGGNSWEYVRQPDGTYRWV